MFSRLSDNKHTLLCSSEHKMLLKNNRVKNPPKGKVKRNYAWILKGVTLTMPFIVFPSASSDRAPVGAPTPKDR